MESPALLQHEETCSYFADLDQAATEHYLNNRMAILVGMLALFSFLLELVENKLVNQLMFIDYFPQRSLNEITIRGAQFVLGAIVFLSGAACLLHHAMYGCSWHKTYLYFAGKIVFVFDVHETAKSWNQLRRSTLVHHAAVFILGLSLTEWGLIQMKWPITLFISLIGVVWTMNVFHILYRTSQDLKFIMRMQNVYLASGLVRFAGAALLAWIMVDGIVRGDYGPAVANGLLATVFCLNSYGALRFVWNFDCAQYYKEHQQYWLEHSERPRGAISHDFNTLERFSSLFAQSKVAANSATHRLPQSSPAPQARRHSYCC